MGDPPPEALSNSVAWDAEDLKAAEAAAARPKPRLEEPAEALSNSVAWDANDLKAAEAAAAAEAPTPEPAPAVPRPETARAPRPITSGARLGRYELFERLGQGAYGTVHRARDPQLGREVAIKLLEKQNERARTRFAREVKLSARLRHPNIVSVHDAGEWQDRPYLVMELVRGKTLDALATPRGLPPARAAELIRDVARALDHAHQRGILHRDVKPHNIIVDRQGVPLVLDFGLAALEEEVGSKTAVGGTPAYMAPEQTGQKGTKLSRATDVWGLGATLYHLLTGRPPFLADNPERVVLAVLRDEPPRPSELVPGLPRPLEELTLRCLRKDPADRPTSAAAVADELERYLAGESRVEAPDRPGGRELGLVPLLACLALAALAGGLGAWVALRPEQAAQPGSVEAPPSSPPPAAASPPWFERLDPARRPPLPLPSGVVFGAGEGEYLLAVPGAPALGLGLVWIEGEGRVPGFFLGRHEVSWAQVAAWLRETGREMPERAGQLERDPSLPAWVSCDEAEAFCGWAGARLPRLAEWELAARRDGPGGGGGSRAVAVDGGRPGRTGCFHLAGNQREWLKDALEEHPERVDSVLRPAPGGGPDRREGPAGPEERLVAGDSWLRAAPPGGTAVVRWQTSADLGFRVALRRAPARPRPFAVEACAFEPEGGERPPHLGTCRGFEQLWASSARRLEGGALDRLELFLEQEGPGRDPRLRGLPGASGFPGDFFALRARSQVELDPGEWIVRAHADDGVRVWVHEFGAPPRGPVLEAWEAGVHHDLTHPLRVTRPTLLEVRVEFLELTGQASLRVAFEPAGE